MTDSVSLTDNFFRNKHVAIADALGVDDTAKGDKSLTLTDSMHLSTTAWVLKTLNTHDELILSDVAATPIRLLQSTDAVALIEAIQAGAGGAKKTRLFLLLGDLALDIGGT